MGNDAAPRLKESVPYHHKSYGFTPPQEVKMTEKNTATIKDLCKKVKRGASSFYLKEGTTALKVIRHANITENGVIDFPSIEPVLVRESDRTMENLLKEGDVLIALRGPAKVAVVPKEGAGFAFSAEFAALEIDSERIRPELIAAYLRLPHIRSYLEEKGQGRTLRSINIQDVLDLTVSIPDNDAQSRLAELLKTVAEERAVVLREQKRIDELEAASLTNHLGGV